MLHSLKKTIIASICASICLVASLVASLVGSMGVFLGTSLYSVASIAEVDSSLYTTLSRPLRPIGDGRTLEVVEFFWYGCPHCYASEPIIAKIKKNLPENATFIRIPATANPRWEVEASIYYALAAKKMTEQTHKRIFDAIHRTSELRRYVGRSIEGYLDFLEKNFKIPKQELTALTKSFGVKSRVAQSRAIGSEYGVRGVPSIYVAGKYKLSQLEVTKADAISDTINDLLKRETKK